MKNVDPPQKKFRGWGSGSAFRSNILAIINFGPHTHLELSGPSFELITIFENFCQKSSKNWVLFGGGAICWK